MSIIAVLVTVYDKFASKKRNCKRVSEKTLLLLGFLGGAFAMFITMLIIRHKTRHKSIMLGLPAIMLLQAVCSWLAYVFIW